VPIKCLEYTGVQNGNRKNISMLSGKRVVAGCCRNTAVSLHTHSYSYIEILFLGLAHTAGNCGFVARELFASYSRS